MKLKLLFFALLAFSVYSCSKDDDDDGPVTNVELISASAWKFDTAGIDANRDGTIDAAIPEDMLESCDTDNTILFRTDGTGTIDEGATKCDDSNPQSVGFTWSFKNNETVINFSDTLFGGLTGDVTIRRLTATQLELAKEVNIGLPIEIPVIVRLKH